MRRMKSRLPTEHTNTILLVPLGDRINTDKTLPDGFCELLRLYCGAFYDGMEVAMLSKPLSLHNCRSRESRQGAETHRQYLIGDIFQLMGSHREVLGHRRAFCVVGFTMEDIYPGEEWNFVFGQARPMERVGVFSFARHDPCFYGEMAPGPQTSATLLWRAMQTMTHEIGHIFGMEHCVYYKCLMNGSNHALEAASRPSVLCPVCLQKLYHAIRFDPHKRYVGLVDALGAIAGRLKRDTVEGSIQRAREWLTRRLAHWE
ncbi:unnamed protein product [Vitrella brassicaformis CCMP3155]|uniref:Archaemetzincin n=1 Tax=Vitrella brassicaformis (strain CCMP3155) TaxID=1169540 RepID=A0A0G4G251_VITBC|nr:unnamed protein product [Vitrella brassicaformis CCMP3155]|eukprot:CEM22060.1 unnamed protein product [Vitrella brassicaformis CCMP3155]